MNENNTTVTRKDISWDVNKLLLIAVGVPIIAFILIVLIMAGGPAVWQAIKTIWMSIFPNFWVILVYAWIGVICYLIGWKKAKK